MEKAEYDVSVLISNFNYSDYVGKAISSVFKAANHGLRIELIVVDDHSTDSSMTVLMEFLRLSPVPMKILRTPWNCGLSKARNLAIGEATGRCVFILDADNSISESALNVLYAAIETEEADAAYGPIRKLGACGEDRGWISDRPFDPGFLIRNGNYIDAMAMFKRSSLISVGCYDARLLMTIGGWEDYELWLRLAFHGCKVAFVPSTIGQYLDKEDSMARRITVDEAKAARALFNSRYAFGVTL